MDRTISRRALCASVLLSPACRRAKDPYFGRAASPSRNRIRFAIWAEPDTLDPTMYTGGSEIYITSEMFESLVSYHPENLSLMAGLATHMRTGEGRLRFYLRGHPAPQGEAFPDTATLSGQFREGHLRQDFARGREAPPTTTPSLWSDGRLVTAHDFVYAWRRLIDPRNAAPYARFLTPVRGAEKILEGKRAPDQLGVRAVDDLTLDVDLDQPSHTFLRFLPFTYMAAVPRWAIESARAQGRESAWTDPDRVVVNGAFRLRDKRAYERILLVRNPGYYEAGLVRLEELEFLPLPDGVRSLDLYRAGSIDAINGEQISPILQPVLERSRDFQSSPAFFVIWHGFNVRRKPFDNVLLRYALNMAADKAEIVKAYKGGRLAARNMIPPFAAYTAARTLPVEVDGVVFDVLSYNPEAARSLLAKAGYPNGRGPDGRPLSFEILFPTLAHSRPIAEMLQQQWKRNLGLAPQLVLRQFSVWLDSLLRVDFPAVAEGGGAPDYYDPNGFLEWFVNDLSGTGYQDRTFAENLRAADQEIDPFLRLEKLARCERDLLRAMPLIPIYHNVFQYLQKPYVHGLTGNVLDKHPFKYAWVDMKWRPEA